MIFLKNTGKSFFVLLIISTLFLFQQKNLTFADLGTCTGSNNQQGFCTTNAPSGNYIPFYTDKVPGTQCGINATNNNAARNSVVYCCTSGSAQYATCGSAGQYVCNTSCSSSNISYTDYAAGTQCGINATKAGLTRNTVVYCMCDSTKQTCPTPTDTPTPTNTPPTDTPTGTPLVGDVNGDGVVNVVDYSLIIGCYGDKFHTDSCTAGAKADLDGDGVVDGVDYNIWLRAFLGVE